MEEAVKQQENNDKKPTGFQLYPENINRNGRPKKGQTLTDIARDILEEELPTGVTRKEALMKKVAQLAYEGNETMIKLLWNYIDGMPTQRQEITGANGGALTVMQLAEKYENETNTDLPQESQPIH